MLVTQTNRKRATNAFSHHALDDVSSTRLRETVEALAYPRHYIANRASNERARDWIADELRAAKLDVSLQGEFDNVIAASKNAPDQPLILLGAHYDTVPTTPGADDNGSAVAVCLEAARVLARFSEAPFLVGVFNREEDGLLGSKDYVESLGKAIHRRVAEAHVFEMVGYYSDSPNSQSIPANLPAPVSKVGNFIGLVSNAGSNKIARQLMSEAKRNGAETPVVSLKTFLGMEKRIPDLQRSDHAPFWEAGVPAIMWTDTSEFRNPNYHAATDTPDSLNYDAMADVTRMIVRHVLQAAGGGK